MVKAEGAKFEFGYDAPFESCFSRKLTDAVPRLFSDRSRWNHQHKLNYFHVCSPEMLPSIEEHGLRPSNVIQEKIASGELPPTNLGYTFGSSVPDSSLFPESVCLTEDYAEGVRGIIDSLYWAKYHNGIVQNCFAVIRVSSEIYKLPTFLRPEAVREKTPEAFIGEVTVDEVIPPNLLLYASLELVGSYVR